MWADPAWRAQKLAEMEAKRPRVAIDDGAMRNRLLDWANRTGPKEELHLTENYGRDGVARLGALCRSLGLFCQSYGKGRNTIVVVAKEELPAYRADLDSRNGHKEKAMYLSERDQNMVEGVLHQLRGTPAPQVTPAPQPGPPIAPQETQRAPEPELDDDFDLERRPIGAAPRLLGARESRHSRWVRRRAQRADRLSFHSDSDTFHFLL